MKKLVLIFVAMFVMGLASCDTKPAGQGNTQDTTVQVVSVNGDTNQVDAIEAAPAETAKDAPEAVDGAATDEPQK